MSGTHEDEDVISADEFEAESEGENENEYESDVEVHGLFNPATPGGNFLAAARDGRNSVDINENIQASPAEGPQQSDEEEHLSISESNSAPGTPGGNAEDLDLTGIRDEEEMEDEMPESPGEMGAESDANLESDSNLPGDTFDLSPARSGEASPEQLVTEEIESMGYEMSGDENVESVGLDMQSYEGDSSSNVALEFDDKVGPASPEGGGDEEAEPSSPVESYEGDQIEEEPAVPASPDYKEENMLEGDNDDDENGPPSHENADLSSFDHEQGELEDEGPASPDDNDENIDYDGPASPVDEVASPEADGPASPEEDGPASPEDYVPDEDDNSLSLAGKEPASPDDFEANVFENDAPASPKGNELDEDEPASPNAFEVETYENDGPASPDKDYENHIEDKGPISDDHVSDEEADRFESVGIASPYENEQNELEDKDGPASPEETKMLEDEAPNVEEQNEEEFDGPASPAADESPHHALELGGPASPREFDSDSDHASPVGSPIRDDDEEEGGAIQSAPEDVESEDEDNKEPRAESDQEDEADIDKEKKKGELDKNKVAAAADSDHEEAAGADSDHEDAAGDQLIADIFGSSDEEEEFEGFGEEDLEHSAAKEKKKVKALVESGSEDEGLAEGLEQEEPAPQDTTKEIDLKPEEPKAESSDSEADERARRKENIVYDFDVMMQKKKEESRSRRRRKRDYDIINDNDDIIAAMIRDMREAAEEDRQLNEERKPAVKKLMMLPLVLEYLNKADLQGALLDQGILTSIADWLSPLPDKSLPNLRIREGFLKILLSLPSLDQHLLKTSGIGKAVMLLYKHPREIRHNKISAGKLINEWSRPIFNLASNFKSMTREEREQRDYQQMPKRRKLSEASGMTPRKDIDKALEGHERDTSGTPNAKALRPGDPGFVSRARVPMPSTKDYIVRPKWNVEMEAETRSSRRRGKPKMDARLEKHMKTFKNKKFLTRKNARAVQISIEGRNMAL